MRQSTESAIITALHVERLDDGELAELLAAGGEDTDAIAAAASSLCRRYNGEVVTCSTVRAVCLADACDSLHRACPPKAPLRSVEEIVKTASAHPEPAALFFCGAGSHKATLAHLKAVFEAVGKALPSAELRGLGAEDLAAVAERAGVSVARAAGELAEAGFARLDALLPVPSGDDENAPLPGSTLTVARWTSIASDAAGQNLLVTAAPLIDSNTTPEGWMRVLKAVRFAQVRTRPLADFAPLYVASETREPGQPDVAARLKLFYAAARLYFAHRIRSIGFNWDGSDTNVAASVVRAGVNAATLFDLSSTTGPAAATDAERALEEIVVASGRKALAKAACR